jgi:glycine oxidase
MRWCTSQNTLSVVKVVIVGAGVIGCAIAYELTGRGAEVVLVDMRQPGAGATQASAGILAPYIEGVSPALLQLGVAGLAAYDRFVEDLRSVSGRDIEYRRAGTLEVALTDAETDPLRHDARRHLSQYVEHRWLDAREARAMEPALPEAIRGALFVPAHGYVNARGLLRALLETAERRGARVTAGSHAQQLFTTGGVLRVVTSSEVVEADAVVVATGSWSAQLPVNGFVREGVRPVRGQLLQLSCSHASVSRVLWGTECYVVPWLDGTLLVGATEEDAGFDEGATVAGVQDLLDAACRLLPVARTARFDGVRVGLRPATRDALPVIGRSAQSANLVYATGHYRSGLLLAPLTASVVADLVLDGRESPHLAFTKPDRFGL